MNERSLHIISFDNPFPPNYGGVIDVYYKVKALHLLDVKIHLHCFVDDIPSDYSALETVTEKVYFYKRKNKFWSCFQIIPFSVHSRFSHKLIERLNQDDFPVFFEGLQSTAVLNHIVKRPGKVFLRLHNNEEKYYKGISKSEKNSLRKWAYRLESTKYKVYQKSIFQQFDNVFTLSETENFEVNSTAGNGVYIPVFHGNNEVKRHSEYGRFALYHGDLRISDNLKAVDFLISVFKKLPDYKLIIASAAGRKFVESKIKNTPSIEFTEIKQESDLKQLFDEAHLHVLYSFQQSGTKLKVINALFKGRFCLINSNMVDDKRIKKLCLLAENETEFKKKIELAMQTPFSSDSYRESVLKEVLDDSKNAKQLAGYFFGL